MLNKSVNAISDTYVLAKRNVKRNFRVPQLLIFSSAQPIIFLLLFNFVFGGAVAGTSEEKYIFFLLPGIMAQIALFGSIQTGVGLAEDLNKGVIDRLRSLPITRSAVLAGRTFADSARNVFVIALITIVGIILGFRIEQGYAKFFAAMLLVLLFAYSFSWVSANIGMWLKDSETVQVAGFLWVFPLVFASSVFVPVATMPSWLQGFAQNQPVTQVVNAVRYLAVGGVPNGQHYIYATILWSLGIIAVFAPLAIRMYRKIQ
ncbi:ABC transporter permease [Candidatus Saccharibacteria bacterium]|nr:ABC transporter permease [Candidatus Saccharibacteria bacterium]MDQ5953882.1 type transport system permease protein [Patescibacteria group bacterium]MDQ5958921.1 type transport system permease protein [Patescibacteria group bacterium]